MNRTIELLLSHRSIRKFKTDPIDDALIRQLVAAGQAASSSSFIQAYTIIEITDPVLRADLRVCAGHQSYITEAPKFLVFCGDMRRLADCAEEHGKNPQMGYTEQLLACSIDAALVAQNLVIAAESMELGAVYIGAIRNNPEEVTRLLKLPHLVVPLFGLCLGYPDQHPAIKPRLPVDTVLHTNQYDSGRFKRELASYEQTTSDYYRKRTAGRITSGWSQQMAQKIEKESRPRLLEFLKSQGFAER